MTLTLKRHAGRVVLGASFAIMFGAWAPHAGFGVFLPVLAREFGWSRGAISVAAALNLFIGGVLGVGVGAASDRYGPRRVMVLTALPAGLCYFFASTVSALWHFYLLLGVFLGVCMSGMYVVPAATVSRWFVERRGLALGTVLSGLNLAYVAGGPLSAFLIKVLGWRAAYLALGGLIWFVVVPASLLLKAPPSESRPLIRTARTSPRGSSPISAMAGTGLRDTLGDRRLWFLLVAWLLLGFANMMVTIHMVPYVTDRGVSLERASLALTIFGLSSIGGRLLSGAATDRLGTVPTLRLCLGLQLLAFISLLTGPPLWVLDFLIIGFGLSIAGADTAIAKSVPEVFGVRHVGAVMSILTLGWRSGAALGPAAAGFIYDATGSYTLAFGLASIGVVASLAFLTLGLSPRRHHADAV